jgi:uncharacterized membrane protein YraQ (UPF0718 family)
MEGKKVLIPTIIVAIFTFVLLFLVQHKGGDAWGAALNGLTTVGKLVPILLLALVAASCLEHIVPESFISKWLGSESGSKGIFIGSLAGICMPPGGAVVLYGIVAGLLKAGAGVGTVVALTTSYNLLALHRLPFEVSMLGWRFFALRAASVVVLAPLAGFLARALVQVGERFFR